MPNRGKQVILLIFLLALAAGALAVWWHWRQGHRALQFWGPTAAVLIHRAPRVQLLLLQPQAEGEGDGPIDELSIAGRTLAVVRRLDISRAAGLIHARHALVEDASFQWPAQRGYGEGGWDCALRFVDGQRAVTVLFDWDSAQVAQLERPQRAVLVARIARGMRAYLQQQKAAAGEPAGKP